MGTCEYCGSRFPLTRSTRKYCTPRCKTNACLDRNPSRLSAAEVRALYVLLGENFTTVDALREELRRIVAPGRPPIEAARPSAVEIEGEEPYIPSLD